MTPGKRRRPGASLRTCPGSSQAARCCVRSGSGGTTGPPERSSALRASQSRSSATATMPDDDTLPTDTRPAQACAGASDAAPSVLLLGTTASEPESLDESGWDWARERWIASPPSSDVQPLNRRAGSSRGKGAHETAELGGKRRDQDLVEPSPAEWMADLEHVWRSRAIEPAARLMARARRRRRQAAAAPADCPHLKVLALRSAEWAEHRARALAMARADVVASCEKRWRTVACGCSRVELKVGCDQPQLCGRCRKRHSAKWSKRITLGLDAALRRERAAYWSTPRYRRRGRAPGVYLITLTAPHSGDLEQDRIVMGVAVRKLLKHATAERWWSTYALTWEATQGEDGRGHMHAHMAVISSWIPYSAEQVLSRDPQAYAPRRPGERRRAPRGLHDVWRDAMPGALVLDVQAPRTNADDAASAAGYLAKYVTKGVDSSEFTGRKAGELLCAFRGRRKVTTNARFWCDAERACECCGDRWRSLGAPESLQDLAPGAVLRSMSERTRYRQVDRVPPQVLVRWHETG